MTAIETFIENYNRHVDNSILEQSIAKALLDPATTDEEIKGIFSSFVFAKYITIANLRECINQYAENKRILSFMNVICEYVKIQASIFDTDKNKYDLVIEHIISEDGYKRMLGRHLWDELDMEHSDINVLEYGEEIQGRFALSILQDMMFPQNRLPKLLPLFNSPYKSVRRILISSLSTYTLNYFGTVKAKVEEGDFLDSQELSLFKEFLDDCDKRFDLYHSCKELHSHYSLPEEYEIARREVAKHLGKQRKKTMKEKNAPFLDMFTRVILGRGGGWRDENGRVQPLGHFSFSQEMPMMLHSLSPLESIEYNNNILFKDWREYK